jgi:O-antigen/teichoic acid export membrane protein
MSSTLAVENFVHKVTLHICAAIIKFTVFGCLLAASDALSNHLVWAVICTAGVDLIIAVAALIISGKLSSIFRLDFCFLVTVLKYSWALMLLSLLITLNYSVDVVILRILSDSRDLGLYAIAIGIVTYSWFLPDVFKDVLIFRTARSDSTDAINLSIKVSASVITIVIVAFVLVGKPLLRIFYGEAFVGSFTVTIILLSGGISMVPFKTISVLLTAQGKRMINLVTLSFSVVANIIANIVLIPSLGMYGAAWSSVISYSIAGIALLLYYCRCEKQTLRQVLLLSRDDFRRLATALKGKLAR